MISVKFSVSYRIFPSIHGRGGINLSRSVGERRRRTCEYSTFCLLPALKRIDYLRELIRKAKSKNQTNLSACFLIGEQEATQQYYVNCVLRGAQVREPGRFCLCLAK